MTDSTTAPAASPATASTNPGRRKVVRRTWIITVVVVVLPVHIFTVRRYVREAPPVYTGERAAMAKRAHEVLGAIRGLDSARAFGLTGRLLTEIEGRSWEVVR